MNHTTSRGLAVLMDATAHPNHISSIWNERGGVPSTSPVEWLILSSVALRHQIRAAS